jgi:short-subunit dehydrogenase
MPIPNNATYAASKAFANTFSESLRGELKSTGVHVTLLAPGPVRTELPDPEDRSTVEKVVPEFLWVNTEYTARVTLDALEKNKMRVVPGLLSKGMSMAGHYTPRAIMAPIVGQMYKKLAGN